MSKKIISFALWGNNPMFTFGIFQNIKLQQRLLPDWICRFYVESTCPKSIINRIKSFGAEVKLVTKAWEKAKYFWRLKVILDKDVEKFLIRDLDSRIGMREKIAVDEWEKSGKTVHLMRDHKRHTVKIMGGMWGAITKEFKELTSFRKNFEEYTKKINSGWLPNVKMAKKGSCQAFLDRRIYPKIKDYALVHTSTHKKETTDKAFPAACPEGGMNFVGQIYNEKNVPQVKP